MTVVKPLIIILSIGVGLHLGDTSTRCYGILQYDFKISIWHCNQKYVWTNTLMCCFC